LVFRSGIAFCAATAERPDQGTPPHAEQSRPPERPAGQRIGVKQGLDEAGLGGDDLTDLRVSALERGEGAVDPVLAV
jgi:hypothetical protein